MYSFFIKLKHDLFGWHYFGTGYRMVRINALFWWLRDADLVSVKCTICGQRIEKAKPEKIKVGKTLPKFAPEEWTNPDKSEELLEEIEEALTVLNTDDYKLKSYQIIDRVRELVQIEQRGAIMKTFPHLWGEYNSFSDEMDNLEMDSGFRSFFYHDRIEKYLEEALSPNQQEKKNV